VSFADPIFDVAFTISHGRMPRFLAKSELWGMPVVKWVLGGGRHIPVHRASIRAKNAYEDAIAAIERGEIVAFYPEGTYTADPDGWPMKAMTGIGRIALLTGAPVIPVANWGTQDVLPPGSGRPQLFPRRRVTVVAGPPVDLSAWLGGPRTRTALDGATNAIMDDVTRLVGEIRGETPPEAAYDPARPGRALEDERPAS
jgi:1-acyl-sn-glycerol-3-phosphate acyltransferase